MAAAPSAIDAALPRLLQLLAAMVMTFALQKSILVRLRLRCEQSTLFPHTYVVCYVRYFVHALPPN